MKRKSFVYMAVLKKSNPDLYQEFTRESRRIRSAMKRRGKCSNPFEKIHLCDGDCVDCIYSQKGNDLVIDVDINESDIASVYPDQIETDELREKCRTLLGYITENYGNEYSEAFWLLSEGYSGREVSDTLNIPNSTFARKIEEIRADVRKKFDS